MNPEIIVAFAGFLALVCAWVVLPGERRPEVEMAPMTVPAVGAAA